MSLRPSILPVPHPRTLAYGRGVGVGVGLGGQSSKTIKDLGERGVEGRGGGGGGDITVV